MLSVRPKVSELAFRVFGRSLHPELFESFESRTINREQYCLRIDITSSGHLLTWQRNGTVLSEVASATFQPLPKRELLFGDLVGMPTSNQICRHNEVDYTFQFQLDPAEPKTFHMIQKELLRSIPCEGMLFQFQSRDQFTPGAISYINIQSRRNNVHVRAFHTFPEAFLVMKSESIFNVQMAEAA